MASQLVTCGIALPIDTHRLLRAAARGRQHRACGRGRASVSSLIAELVMRHQSELESDAATPEQGDGKTVILRSCLGRSLESTNGQS